MKAKKPLIVIDSTVLGVIQIGILNEGVLKRISKHEYSHGSSFLEILVRYLNKKKIKETGLRGIALVEGKGSFSAVRAAVAVLNVLQWTKKIAIAGFDCRVYAHEKELYAAIENTNWRVSHKPILPIYQGEPHITYSKAKVNLV